MKSHKSNIRTTISTLRALRKIAREEGRRSDAQMYSDALVWVTADASKLTPIKEAGK